MVQDPKTKAPPLPPPPPQALQAKKQKPPLATPVPPSSPQIETVITRPSLVPPSLTSRLRSFLSPILRGSLLVDGGGQVMLQGARIGEFRNNAFLIEYGPAFSFVSIPPAMRVMAEARKMVLFFEITENSVALCAGNTLGQKTLYTTIG